MKKPIMKKLRHIQAYGRIALVVFGLLALLICGASSVYRLTDSAKAEKTELPDQACFIPDPTDSQSPSENMTPGTAPNAEPAAIITQAILLGGLGSEDNWSSQRLGFYNVSIQNRPIKRGQTKLASLALVNSALSRQFTLVGAKPSGTG